MTTTPSKKAFLPNRTQPEIDSDTAPFWQSCHEHQMKMQQCVDCGTWRFTPRILCPECLSDKFEWKAVSGKGTVYTFVTFHQVYGPEYEGKVPYNVSMIELAEGPRMWSNVIGIPPSEVKIGMPVRVVYEDEDDVITIAKFEPDR